MLTDHVLEILRSQPTSVNDLDPQIRQFLRDLFQHGHGFNADERGLLEGWWFVLPLEQAAALEALNEGTPFKIVPSIDANGQRLIPAALLSDPIHYGRAFEFLSALILVEGFEQQTEP